MDANAAIPPFLVLAVAAYFPLNTLRDGVGFLLRINPVRLTRSCANRFVNRSTSRGFEQVSNRLTPITVGVPEVVRSQYEQNPYPRWVKIAATGTGTPLQWRIAALIAVWTLHANG